MSKQATRRRPRLQLNWASAIPEGEWQVYTAAMEVLRGADIEFMLGGGFALAAYTGRWRDTKDIDFYIAPQDRERAVQVLTKAGFADYYDQLPYDRKWIYRSTRSDTIVDVIWAMANQRARVDASWFERAPLARIRDQELRLLPIEKFLWCKFYILQRDRCDWIDIFNLLYVNGQNIDWARLLNRLGEDTPLLQALLTVYNWFCPGQALKLPESLRRRLSLTKPKPAPPRTSRDRMRFLDSRAWFAALKSMGEKLDI